MDKTIKLYARNVDTKLILHILYFDRNLFNTVLN